MRSESLALYRGALHQLHAMQSVLTPQLLAAVQVQDVEWQSFTQAAPWMEGEAHQAEITLSKLVSLGYRLAGTPRIAIIAEHLAATIVTFVAPPNWGPLCALAATGLEGTKLLMPDGDEYTSRESVSAERLYAMVLSAHTLHDTVFREDDAAKEEMNGATETEQARHL